MAPVGPQPHIVLLPECQPRPRRRRADHRRDASGPMGRPFRTPAPRATGAADETAGAAPASRRRRWPGCSASISPSRCAPRAGRWTARSTWHRMPPARPVVVAFWHERLPLMPMLWLKARAVRRGPAHAQPRARPGQPASRRPLHRRGRQPLRARRGARARPRAAAPRVCASCSTCSPAATISRSPRTARAGRVASRRRAWPSSPRCPACRCCHVPRRPRGAGCCATWDRMVVPKPFGRGVVVCLPTIAVQPRRLAGHRAGDRRRADRGGRAGRPAVPRLNLPGAVLGGGGHRGGAGPAAVLRVRQARGKEVTRAARRSGAASTPTPRPPGRLIWLHAASVGETMSILPVLPELAEARRTHHPADHRHGDLGEAAGAAARAGPGRGACCTVSPRSTCRPGSARFLDHWQPDAAGFVESELWPNLLAACRARRIPMMLINARLSDRSLRRWRRVPALARHVLGGFARVQPRSETDADRLRSARLRRRWANPAT